MTPPRPGLESVKRFWEAHVNNEYYTRAERASAAYFREIEERRYRWHYHLNELLTALQGSSGRLLEIGCGMGMDSVRLARCGFQVTALDLTEAALDVARRYAREQAAHVDFRLGNAERLDFADESFDAVYSFGVLHHTPHPDKAVAELHRVLKPGGRAFVMLYHRNSLVNLVHWAFRLPYESPKNLRDQCPIVYTFTRQSARRLFSAFSAVEIHADYPFTYGFGLGAWLTRPVLKALGRRIGWHLMITAVR